MKETKIGGYYYPLRALAVAIVIGAGCAVLATVLLVQILGG